MAVLENLEPKKVFHYFEEICNIPHPSYKEKKDKVILIRSRVQIFQNYNKHYYHFENKNQTDKQKGLRQAVYHLPQSF